MFLAVRILTLFFFLLMSSCIFGGSSGGALSANVDIIVAPYGAKDTRFAGNPIIFLSPGQKICRFYPYRAYTARAELKASGLKEDFLDILFGTTEEREEPIGSGEAVRVNVSENWLEFGLFIQNKNKGENAYHLLVRTLSFIATARCGEEEFEHSGEITAADYCLSESEENPPFLYFIPSGKAVRYRSVSKNSFENLRIYLSGFPIVDRSGEVSTSISNPSCKPNQIRAIPDYNVELVLIGEFISNTGNTVGEFIKRTSFFTRSSSEL